MHRILHVLDEILTLGGKIYSFPAFNGKNIFKLKKIWNSFLLEHKEYKILHSHVRSYASVYIPIAKKHGLKTIVHSHSTSNVKGVPAVVKKLMQYPLRYQSDCFFSCSMEAGQWLFGKKVASSERHFVLNNSIDVARFRFSSVKRDEYRRNMKLDTRKAYIHVGRFNEAKNHAFLLRVFQKIHEKQNDSILILVGDGSLREKIEDQIKSLHLDEAVRILGNRTDIPELLQAADVFLFPSLWEGLGIVAIEAQAAGLPCLCSDQVPAAVKVVQNCVFLPLQENEWVEAALNTGINRTDAYNQIVSAGYDVYENVKWLQEFYLQMIRGN